MRLSELIGSEVVDARGRHLGRVLDVDAVQDGPLVEGFGALPRVTRLVVGRRGFLHRLGYDRAEMQGPWLLRAVFSRLARGQRDEVPWEAVESWGGRTVALRAEWRAPATRR